MTLIRPPRGWRLANIRELWQYRELVLVFVWRDVKVRYRQTVLGIAWAILQPALMVAVFTVVFGRLASLPSAGIPYPLFALTGVLPWMFFASAVTSAANSVVQSERLVNKIYFPRLAIPIAAVGVAAVDFVVAFSVLAVLMVWYGAWPGPAIMLIMPTTVLMGAAGIAFGTGLAALNIRFRDVRFVVPFLIQFWMFATPSVYMQPPVDVSGPLAVLLWVNPLTALVDAFRAACLGLPFPLTQFLVSGSVILALVVITASYFRSVESDFADVI